MDPSRQCTAKSQRSGNQCKRPAITGGTVCAFHGGSAKQVKAKAAKRIAEQAAQVAIATYGLPRDIDPHAALIEELHRTAGHVAWLGMIVAELDSEDGRGKLIEKTMFGEQPAIWIKLYADERRHFTDVAKVCIGANIEERRVKIAEEQGQLLATAIRGILTDLGVADDERVPGIVRRHLMLVAGDG